MKTNLKTKCVMTASALVVTLAMLALAPTATAYNPIDTVERSAAVAEKMVAEMSVTDVRILLTSAADPLCPIEHYGDPWGVDSRSERYCILGQTQTGLPGVGCHYRDTSTGPNHGLPVAYTGSETCIVVLEADGDLCYGYYWYYHSGEDGKRGDPDGHTCEREVHMP